MNNKIKTFKSIKKHNTKEVTLLCLRQYRKKMVNRVK